MPAWTDKELTDGLRELAQRALDRDAPMVSWFLTDQEQELALRLGRQAGVEAALEGGFADAERRQCCFYPAGERPRLTLCCLKLSWRKNAPPPGHRDVLGSVLGLGLERKTLGDIRVEDDGAYVIAAQTAARVIESQLLTVGRTQVTTERLEQAPELEREEGTLLQDTVPSLRLDAVLASGMRTSRGKAAAWIQDGAVQVNHETRTKADSPVAPGDVISIRGFGRLRLDKAGGENRKGRLPITLMTYGKNHPNT